MCSTTLNGIKLKICLVSDKNTSLLKLSCNIGLSVLLLKKNVLQGQHEADKIWSKEGFYAVVIFLSIFVIIVTCLMILYRLKEKFQLSLRQDKEKKSGDPPIAPRVTASPV